MVVQCKQSKVSVPIELTHDKIPGIKEHDTEVTNKPGEEC